MDFGPVSCAAAARGVAQIRLEIILQVLKSLKMHFLHMKCITLFGLLLFLILLFKIVFLLLSVATCLHRF